MATPLNPALHARIVRVFGRARIANAGQRFDARLTRDLLTERMKFVYADRGETYLVNCPYCRDTRFRLSINHMWGELDAGGRRLEFLAYCYNEDCLSDPAHRRDFLGRMANTSFLPPAPLAAERGPARPLAKPVLPGTCVPFAQLGPTHPAVAYMASRGFDPVELSRKYHLSACAEAPSRWSMAVGRVIVPVVHDGQLVGWQGRYPDDLDWKKTGIPKYFTMPGMPTSRYLFNFYRAQRWETGVLVEGLTDVFAFGSMALASFGKTVTPQHVDLLRRGFFGRTFVMLHDPDTQGSERAKANEEALRRAFGASLAVVWLPAGTDPGKLDRSFLWPYVTEHAAAQGVRVRFQLVNREP